MAALTIRLDDELHDRLRRAAFERRWSMNSIIAAAIEEILDHLDKVKERSSDH